MLDGEGTPGENVDFLGFIFCEGDGAEGEEDAGDVVAEVQG